MIVSRARRFIYYGLPKTASTSLHDWLSQPALCLHRWAPGNGGQHHAIAPHDAAGYFVFASIRHPFDRIVSLWYHSQSPWSLATDSHPMTFAEFVLDFQPTAIYFYRDSQAEILAGVRVDAYVRFDQLESDLLALPLISQLVRLGVELEPLPHLNSPTIEYSPDLVTPDLAAVIRDRWAADWDLADWG